jgi:hypothetical protein
VSVGRGFAHERPVSETTVWLTPPAMLAALGPFDLDPCAAEHQPWRTAVVQYTVAEDGLIRRWRGFVWCNPPFGRGVEQWLARMARHGNGIALVPARTETRWFVEGVWQGADGVLFLHGRPRFHPADGSPAPGTIGTPVCLAAYGAKAVHRLQTRGLAGTFVTWRAPPIAS